ncbi:hypothetical protein RJ55_01605 [Drechmeria coniospora]|nr:hypothetical protein RJ55_01605 [Drechmeria coniospora]
MAPRGPGGPHARPDVGDTLIVIHDFHARSSDELSLAKGDRVELIERDDEFGDGWFLGRHRVNGNTGLFPEVYTRLAPKPAPVLATSKPLTPVAEAQLGPEPTAVPSAPSKPTQISMPLPSPPVSKLADEKVATPPLISAKPDPAVASVVSNSSSSSPAPGLGRMSNKSQDNQVLNETLNVIDEHITNLRSPLSSRALRAQLSTDSGSDYSGPLDQRLSYIQGEETDEEEEDPGSGTEVKGWTPDDVADYLLAAGVEKQHCDVFRDQEISGEVLLGMDQGSLFIKAFDLGSVGRRLKTWHKIKALQDEASGRAVMRTTKTRAYGSDLGSEDARQPGNRTRSLTNTTPDQPTSTQRGRQSSAQTAKQTPLPSPTTLHPYVKPHADHADDPHFNSTVSPQAGQDGLSGSGQPRRPSAASIRDLHHSRRHSSTTDVRLGGDVVGVTPAASSNGTGTGTDGTHKKQRPSFDRNWTLGGALSAQAQSLPMSATDPQDAPVVDGVNPEASQDSAVDMDHDYLSGPDADGRRRNVLRKRDNSQLNKSSYIEEQRVRSATAISRHSRFGSVDSFRDAPPTPAIQKYFGIHAMSHHPRRTASTNTTDSIRPAPPAKDGPSPAVTNLDAAATSRQASSPPTLRHPGFHSDWFSSMVGKPMGKRPGMRAISDKLTINRSKDLDSPELQSKDGSQGSPAATGTTTPSAAPSFDLDSPATGKSFSPATQPSNANRKKTKKETSAYTRGLLKISPQEAQKDADYSGWMKKKSSHLMTTWKPRLFVLKGRRLAYYYSEDDEEEKGLIDISFHRVLPADNEKLTGFHATITGVGAPGLPSADTPAGLDKGDDSLFIFKLVPPRAGLSRAVNFTKPTVHYFAVPNLQQGRLWMAALMKATIDRDDSQPITTTYQQKTISLAKAMQMRHRPPALMNLEEAAGEEHKNQPPYRLDSFGMLGESDSGVSGMDKLAAAKIEEANLSFAAGEREGMLPPQSA